MKKSSLLTGNPIRSIIMFALPIMGGSLLQYSYNIVDSIIVGRYVGTDALAAVGNVSSINTFIVGASLGLTSGFTIQVAQLFGAGNKKKMNMYSGNSITLSFVIFRSLLNFKTLKPDSIAAVSCDIADAHAAPLCSRYNGAECF